MRQALALLISLAEQVPHARHFRIALGTEGAERGRLVVEFVTDRVPRFVLTDNELDLPVAEVVAMLVAIEAMHREDPMPESRTCPAEKPPPVPRKPNWQPMMPRTPGAVRGSSLTATEQLQVRLQHADWSVLEVLDTHWINIALDPQPVTHVRVERMDVIGQGAVGIHLT